MFAKVFYKGVLWAGGLFMAICLGLLWGCEKESEEGGISKNDGGEEGDTPGDPIEVVDGKVRFYVSESSSAARASMGLTRDWSKSTVTVNGLEITPQAADDGRYYVEALYSSSDTYTATLTNGDSDYWYESSANIGVMIPYSQFYGSTVKSLGSFPMYAEYTEENGNKLIFKDSFGVIDLALTGSDKIASVKVTNPSGKVMAGKYNYLPTSGVSMASGVDFAVLNCTDHGNFVSLTGAATHFYVLVVAGTYSSGIDITVGDSGHRAMFHSTGAMTIEASVPTTISLEYKPDNDLVFYEGFDLFVWGGNVMAGEGSVGFAPTDDKVTYNTFTDRDGYADAFTEVAYNVPGTAFVQSNTWSDVNGFDVATSHQLSDSYVLSRNISDYTYLFRTMEFQGCVAVGPSSAFGGTSGRGIIQTGYINNIEGTSNLRLEFDAYLEYGFDDNLLLEVFRGMIGSVTIDGADLALTSDNYSFKNVTATLVDSKVVLGETLSNSSAKTWHHVVVDILNGSNSTVLYFASNNDTASIRGIYLDNIIVRKTASTRTANTVRVLYWNIQNGMWSDQPNNYDNFVAWVKTYDPDICVWCEAQTIYKDNTNSSTSDRYLPDGWAALAARYGHSYAECGGWRDNFPQEVTSKYPITTLLKITDTDDSSKPIQHGAAIQQVNVNGTDINFVTLHMWPQSYAPGASDQSASTDANEGDYYREYEIDYIISHTVNDSRYSTQSNWVMLGDFNSRSRKDNWYYGYDESDTRLITQDKVLNETDLVDVIGTLYEGSFVASTSGSTRIDFVYASPAMWNRVQNAYTVTDIWTLPVVSPYVSNFYDPSDHRPILVDFEFN